MKWEALFRRGFLVLAIVTPFVLNPSNRLAAADPTAKRDLVFLLVGQSNMAGHGRSEELPQEYAETPANVLFYEAGAFRPLVPRRANQQNSGGGRFGPEVAFGYELARAMPDRTILLVKHAIGGTSLSGHWNPQRGRLYDQLLTDYRAAIKDRNSELGAILWSQGGADAKQEASAKAYAANFKELIQAFRKDLEAQDVPIYFGSARPEDPTSAAMKSRFPHLGLVRAAFVEAEQSVPHAHLVSTVGLQVGGDGIHYDTAGQIEFGKRFGQAYLRSLKDAGKGK